jgi:hypothetical protein
MNPTQSQRRLLIAISVLRVILAVFWLASQIVGRVCLHITRALIGFVIGYRAVRR